MNRFKIAKILAGVGTLLAVPGTIMMCTGTHGGIIALLGVIIGIVSYFFAGFFEAIKMVFKIAISGFKAGPFMGIILWPITILAGIFSFFILPIIPVVKSCENHGM